MGRATRPTTSISWRSRQLLESAKTLAQREGTYLSNYVCDLVQRDLVGNDKRFMDALIYQLTEVEAGRTVPFFHLYDHLKELTRIFAKIERDMISNTPMVAERAAPYPGVDEEKARLREDAGLPQRTEERRGSSSSEGTARSNVRNS